MSNYETTKEIKNGMLLVFVKEDGNSFLRCLYNTLKSMNKFEDFVKLLDNKQEVSMSDKEFFRFCRKYVCGEIYMNNILENYYNKLREDFYKNKDKLYKKIYSFDNTVFGFINSYMESKYFCTQEFFYHAVEKGLTKKKLNFCKLEINLFKKKLKEIGINLEIYKNNDDIKLVKENKNNIYILNKKNIYSYLIFMNKKRRFKNSLRTLPKTKSRVKIENI